MTEFDAPPPIDLVCTVCSVEINDIVGVFEHARIPVATCAFCAEQFDDGDGEDARADDEACAWCGASDDVELLCCDEAGCGRGWCVDCVERNCGREHLERVIAQDPWRCFHCEPRPLTKLRARLERALAAATDEEEEGDEEEEEDEEEVGARAAGEDDARRMRAAERLLLIESEIATTQERLEAEAEGKLRAAVLAELRERDAQADGGGEDDRAEAPARGRGGRRGRRPPRAPRALPRAARARARRPRRSAPTCSGST